MILKEQKTQKEIKNDLKEILTNYQIPKKIKFLEAFPLNNSGKIDKNKLKELV
jgi:non-ribosomal peptide synthetase component E (peptide arylation enzyme)